MFQKIKKWFFTVIMVDLKGAHWRNEERSQGGPAPPPKEHNWENREQNEEKSCKIRSFWGVVIHENTCCKTKFKSSGAEVFWAPLNL